VPVFDSQKVLEVHSQDEIRDYLVELLVSFIRVNQFTIYLNRGRGIYFKKVLSDMVFDLLVEMSEIVDEPYRFVFLKRAVNAFSKRRSVKRHCPGTIKMERKSSTMVTQKSRRAR